MKVIIQRVSEGTCSIDGEISGSITEGLVVLAGFTHVDTHREVEWMAEKIVNLRIFENTDGKFDKSLLDISGEVLSISQFTLYGDAQKGRRPSFTEAARPEGAEPLYHLFNEKLREKKVTVAEGKFGADMQISLTNNGPVTLTLESPGPKA
ncbi:D-aminoacyl-tRNA deacylase [Sinobaca sp. H24]|uniref:D-aminoacyl-tRNA deacylase n=1 Tax=Sinobaca sp. H24 TaxID=2923376 RepID=UPI00207AF3C7|nr:D-aminoacyl-tRNA deacylase [Sinobaca sp. H24]